MPAEVWTSGWELLGDLVVYGVIAAYAFERVRALVREGVPAGWRIPGTRGHRP